VSRTLLQLDPMSHNLTDYQSSSYLLGVSRADSRELGVVTVCLYIILSTRGQLTGECSVVPIMHCLVPWIFPCGGSLTDDQQNGASQRRTERLWPITYTSWKTSRSLVEWSGCFPTQMAAYLNGTNDWWMIFNYSVLKCKHGHISAST
jgi:hypothetical protein